MKSFSIITLAVVAACGTSESSGLLTKGISADMSAITSGNGTTTVTAELFEGNPDQLIFVDLEPGDQLVASAGGDSATLVKAQLVTIISYTAGLPTGNEGDEITIDFQREVDAGAPSSVAVIPAPFTVDPVVASSSRATAMTLTYSPADTGDDMRWDATGDCIQTGTGAAGDDTGSITIPASGLVTASGQTTASCTVTLSITRVRAGTVDAHFKGGNISGEQTRTVTFTSTP